VYCLHQRLPVCVLCVCHLLLQNAAGVAAAAAFCLLLQLMMVTVTLTLHDEITNRINLILQPERAKTQAPRPKIQVPVVGSQFPVPDSQGPKSQGPNSEAALCQEQSIRVCGN